VSHVPDHDAESDHVPSSAVRLAPVNDHDHDHDDRATDHDPNDVPDPTPGRDRGSLTADCEAMTAGFTATSTSALSRTTAPLTLIAPQR